MKLPRHVRLLSIGLVAASASCTAVSSRDQTEPPSPARAASELNVGFLVVEGVYNTELTAPLDIFHHTVFHTQPGMRVFLVGPTLDPVTSFEGLRVLPDYTYESAPRIDVLVVPSAEHSMDTDLADPDMMGFVRRAGRDANYVLSLCDGAFVLAAAGLLDGREATTFPSDISRMRSMFPELVIHEDVSFVHDGPAITSAGGALSFDAALYLAELLYGAEAARGIGRGMCIDWNAATIPKYVAASD